MLLSLQGTVTIVGLCIAYWLDFGFRYAIKSVLDYCMPNRNVSSYIDGSVQWRFPIAFQAVFAILLVLQMLPLPETPRYLVLNNHNETAGEVLARLHPEKDITADHPDVVYFRTQIESAIETESAGGPFRYSELLTGGRVQNFRRVVLCMAVNVMQQFTGSNMINYYAPVVYQQTMGLSRTLSLILGGCTSLTYLVGSIIPLWVREIPYDVTASC